MIIVSVKKDRICGTISAICFIAIFVLTFFYDRLNTEYTLLKNLQNTAEISVQQLLRLGQIETIATFIIISIFGSCLTALITFGIWFGFELNLGQGPLDY